MTTSDPSFSTVKVTAGNLSNNLSSGDLLVAGGGAFAGGVSVGKQLKVFSEAGNPVSIRTAVNTEPYILTFPPSLPAADNFALTSTTAGVLSWQEMTTKNPTFESVRIARAVPSSGPALVVDGGSVKIGAVTLIPPNVSTDIQFTLPASRPSVSEEPQMMVSDSSGTLAFRPTPRALVQTKSFAAKNNIAVPKPVLDLVFAGVANVDVFVTVSTSTAVVTAIFTLKAYPTPTGYVLFQTSVGDENTGIAFQVEPATGRVTYVSSNRAGWLSTSMTWKSLEMVGTMNASDTVVVYAQYNVSNTDISGFIVSGEKFTRDVLVTVTTGTTLSRTVYQLCGVRRNDGAYDVFTTILGSDAGVTFSVPASGQVRYTTGAPPAGWVRTSFQIDVPQRSVQDRGTFQRLEVSGTDTDSLIVKGGLTMEGDIRFSKGDIIPRYIDLTGLEAAALPLSGGNCVYRFVHSGTPRSSVELMTAMVEGASYEIGFSLSEGVSSNTAGGADPSYIQLFPNGSTAYGNVFAATYFCNGSGSMTTRRTTTNAFRFDHSTVGENATGDSYAGTFRIFNSVANKTVMYDGGGNSGYANGKSRWTDQATAWTSLGTLNSPTPFAQWFICIRRLT
jgi:hypothetical protein